MTSDSRTKVQPDVKPSQGALTRREEGFSPLLPLPEPDHVGGNDVFGKEFPLFTTEQAESYARANMEPLIVENERLRAEVAMLTHAVKQGHATIKLGHQLHDALANEMREVGVMVESDPIRVLNLRAERLTEALRHTKEKLEHVAAIRGGHGTFAGTYLIVTEALDQEGGNG